MVARMVNHMQQNIAARHHAAVSADQGERHFFVQDGIGQTVAPGDVPVIDALLRAP